LFYDLKIYKPDSELAYTTDPQPINDSAADSIRSIGKSRLTANNNDLVNDFVAKRFLFAVNRDFPIDLIESAAEFVNRLRSVV